MIHLKKYTVNETLPVILCCRKPLASDPFIEICVVSAHAHVKIAIILRPILFRRSGRPAPRGGGAFGEDLNAATESAA